MSEANTLRDDLESAVENAAEETTEVEELEAVEAVGEELEPIDPPHMWGKDYREMFTSWGELENGRKYQEAMSNLWKETQGHVTKKEQEAAQYRRQYEQFNGLFDPYRQEMQMRGINPVGLTNQLVGYYANLMQDPSAGIQRIAQEFGVDLNKLVAEQPYVPDEVRALQSRIDAFERQQAAQTQQAQQAEAQEVMKRLETFANEQDASGNLKRPHLAAVEGEMVQLIWGWRAQNEMRTPSADTLQTLYERACRLNEDVSAEIAKEQGVKEAARKAQEANKAVSAAKRPKGKHTGANKPPASLREHLEQAVQAANAAT